MIYVLDEPSIGLHSADNARLIAALERLRDIGNTVVIVEHDEEMIRSADWLIDIGPGAGIHGGKLLAAGTPAQVISHKDSITGKWLSGESKRELNKKAAEKIGELVIRMLVKITCRVLMSPFLSVCWFL